MAEEKAAASTAEAAPAKAQKPTLFIILAIINMLVVVGVGYMLYQGKKKEAAQPNLQQAINGEVAAHGSDVEAEGKASEEFAQSLVPMKTFVVNMAGSRGRRLARVNMELEVENEQVREEIISREAQIRDIIIILLSSKTFESVSSREGKDALRDEIREQVSGFLTKGKIKRVYFTEFIYN